MNINLTLVIQGLAFFATAWLVMKFGWPLIDGAIVARQKKIADGLAAAEEGKRALASASAKQDEVIREALRDKVAELAVKGAERLIRKEIDAKAHKELLDDLISEIAR